MFTDWPLRREPSLMIFPSESAKRYISGWHIVLQIWINALKVKRIGICFGIVLNSTFSSIEGKLSLKDGNRIGMRFLSSKWDSGFNKASQFWLLTSGRGARPRINDSSGGGQIQSKALNLFGAPQSPLWMKYARLETVSFHSAKRSKRV